MEIEITIFNIPFASDNYLAYLLGCLHPTLETSVSGSAPPPSLPNHLCCKQELAELTNMWKTWV